VVGIIHRVDYLAQTFRAEDSQWFCAALNLRRPSGAEKKWREATHVVQVEMADPDGVEIRPVKAL
jgi:hypothetical protein